MFFFFVDISVGSFVNFFLRVLFVSFLLAIPYFTSYRFVERMEAMHHTLLSAGVGTNYYDFKWVRDAYLLIAGYQRYIENADEDGWE